MNDKLVNIPHPLMLLFRNHYLYWLCQCLDRVLEEKGFLTARIPVRAMLHRRSSRGLQRRPIACEEPAHGRCSEESSDSTGVLLRSKTRQDDVKSGTIMDRNYGPKKTARE